MGKIGNRIKEGLTVSTTTKGYTADILAEDSCVHNFEATSTTHTPFPI